MLPHGTRLIQQAVVDTPGVDRNTIQRTMRGGIAKSAVQHFVKQARGMPVPPVTVAHRRIGKAVDLLQIDMVTGYPADHDPAARVPKVHSEVRLSHRYRPRI